VRLSDKVFVIDSERFIEAADFFDAALPLGFFDEPLILSFLGAGVCDADFLPLRFKTLNYLHKNKYYL
jgi:hypothetical protein